MDVARLLIRTSCQKPIDKFFDVKVRCGSSAAATPAAIGAAILQSLDRVHIDIVLVDFIDDKYYYIEKTWSVYIY
jgi:hypothetical protein